MIKQLLWWWNSMFTNPGFSGIVQSRLPLQDQRAMEKTLYMLAPNPTLPWTYQSSGVGYAPSGRIGIEYPNDAVQGWSAANRPNQPSGLAGPAVNALGAADLLALANVLEPGN